MRTFKKSFKNPKKKERKREENFQGKII